MSKPDMLSNAQIAVDDGVPVRVNRPFGHGMDTPREYLGSVVAGCPFNGMVYVRPLGVNHRLNTEYREHIEILEARYIQTAMLCLSKHERHGG